MLCVSFLSIRKCFHLFVIVVSESLSCPQCEKMDLKIIQSLLERVHICRGCWKTKNVQELEDSAQDKQGTHEQLSQNIKTVVDHPGNNTVRFKGM